MDLDTRSTALKLDDALKIITPWWDVLTKYLAAAIMTIAVATVALQATRDNLVCVPVVKCSVANSTKLVNTTRSICSKVEQDKLQRGSTTTVLTSLKDVQLHAFVNSACFQSLERSSAFFPFILFAEAVALLVADCIWAVVNPKTSLTLLHFVSIVKECYDSDVEKSPNHAKSEDVKKSPNHAKSEDVKKSPNHAKSEVLKKNRSGQNEEIISLVQKGGSQQGAEEAEEISSANSSNLSDHAAQPETSTKVKSLYDKVEKFQNAYSNMCVWKVKKCTCECRNCVCSNSSECVRCTCCMASLITVYTIQAILKMASSVAVVVLNSCYFKSAFNNSFDCTLTEVFAMQYDYFMCSRGIAPYYEITTWVFVGFVGAYLLISLVGLIYMINFICWKKCKLNMHQEGDTKYNVDIEGDLAFLCFLLKKHNEVHYQRLADCFYQKKKIEAEQKARENGRHNNAATNQV